MMSQCHSHLSLTLCFSVNLRPFFSQKRCGASIPYQLHTDCYSDDRKERTLSSREIKTEERESGGRRSLQEEVVKEVEPVVNKRN